MKVESYFFLLAIDCLFSTLFVSHSVSMPKFSWGNVILDRMWFWYHWDNVENIFNKLPLPRTNQGHAEPEYHVNILIIAETVVDCQFFRHSLKLMRQTWKVHYRCVTPKYWGQRTGGSSEFHCRLYSSPNRFGWVSAYSCFTWQIIRIYARCILVTVFCLLERNCGSIALAVPSY